jgi:hypothetical protein
MWACTVLADGSSEDAEWVPSRVEQDPNVLLRLVVGLSGASLQGPGDACLEIFDSDV